MALDTDVVIPADMDRSVAPNYWRLRDRLADNVVRNNNLTIEWPEETRRYLVEERGPAGIVKAHEASFYDAISLGIMYTLNTERRLVQICDENDLKFPGLSGFLKSLGGEPIDWKNARLDEETELVQKYQGSPHSFLIMPDASYGLYGEHYTPDGRHADLRDFNLSYLDLARHTKRPIVPATINGLDKVYAIKKEMWGLSYVLKKMFHLPELRIPSGLPHDWRAVVANQFGISYDSNSWQARLLGISHKPKHDITVLLGPLIPYPTDTSQYDAVNANVREEIQKLRAA